MHIISDRRERFFFRLLACIIVIWVSFAVTSARADIEELLKVQAETVQQAEESLRIANLRHKNGMITSVELMDTELAFTQAQTNQFNALHDYVIAVAKLEKASASNLD